MQLLIFTDLDGTLLDHEDYGYEAAKPCLARIKAEGIPLIMVTSKTRQEVEHLRAQMGIGDPFIVENGGGLFFPRGYRDWIIDRGGQQGDYTVIPLGTSYSQVRRFVERFGAEFAIRGFGDMKPEEIAGLTGLSLKQAVLAAKREFTEPFVLERPEALPALEARAAAAGLKVTRGGRLHHLIGAGQDKGLAVRAVCDIFRRHCCGGLTTVALGDSENDLPMLAQVDVPVLIPRPDGRRLETGRPDVIQAQAPGSRGWNGTVSVLLDRFGRVKAEGAQAD